VVAPEAKPTSAAEQPAAPSRRTADGRLRIGLASLNGEAVREIRLPRGGAILDGTTGKRLRTAPPGARLKLVANYPAATVQVKGNSEVWAERPSVTLQASSTHLGRRRYPGKLHVRLAGTGLELVNELDIEQYLEGVLPGELPAGFGIEAQKALAVAARSYALVQQGKHGEFDLCDQTCCQMYLGDHRGSTRGLAAVRATRRECLFSGDDLVYAFYSADCGGKSTSITEVPLRDKPEVPLPYLRPVKDAPPSGPDYCANSPYHQWVRRYTRQELEARLNRRPQTEVGTLTDVKFTDVDPTGRVRSVLLRGIAPPEPGTATLLSNALPTAPIEKLVTGWEFRRSVGALALKSTLMRLDQPQPDVYRFSGSGFGHGLGLCQIGANGMAMQGHTYREILAHYYPGTRIAELSD
jgi:stage II sporulation protein D